MGDFELKAGGTVRVLTPDEFDAGVARITGALASLERVVKAQGYGPITRRVTAAMATDAAGAIGGGTLASAGLVVYTAPTGRTAHITRVALANRANTPATPLAAGWLAGYFGEPSASSLVFGAPDPAAGGGANVLPTVRQWNYDQAPILRNGENLVVVGAALPVSSAVGINLTVVLEDELEAPAR